MTEKPKGDNICQFNMKVAMTRGTAGWQCCDDSSPSQHLLGKLLPLERKGTESSDIKCPSHKDRGCWN